MTTTEAAPKQGLGPSPLVAGFRNREATGCLYKGSTG